MKILLLLALVFAHNIASAFPHFKSEGTNEVSVRKQIPVYLRDDVKFFAEDESKLDDDDDDDDDDDEDEDGNEQAGAALSNDAQGFDSPSGVDESLDASSVSGASFGSQKVSSGADAEELSVSGGSEGPSKTKPLSTDSQQSEILGTDEVSHSSGGSSSISSAPVKTSESEAQGSKSQGGDKTSVSLTTGDTESPVLEAQSSVDQTGNVAEKGKNSTLKTKVQSEGTESHVSTSGTVESAATPLSEGQGSEAKLTEIKPESGTIEASVSEGETSKATLDGNQAELGSVGISVSEDKISSTNLEGSLLQVDSASSALGEDEANKAALDASQTGLDSVGASVSKGEGNTATSEQSSLQAAGGSASLSKGEESKLTLDESQTDLGSGSESEASTATLVEGSSVQVDSASAALGETEASKLTLDGSKVELGSVGASVSQAEASSSNLGGSPLKVDSSSASLGEPEASKITLDGSQTEISSVGTSGSAGQTEISNVGTSVSVGQAEISSVGTSGSEGQAEISSVGTSGSEGQAEISSVGTSGSEGQTEISSVGTSGSEGQAEISSVGTSGSEGQVEISSVGTSESEGQTEISSVGTSGSEGQTEISSVGTSGSEGQVITGTLAEGSPLQFDSVSASLNEAEASEVTLGGSQTELGSVGASGGEGDATLLTSQGSQSQDGISGTSLTESEISKLPLETSDAQAVDVASLNTETIEGDAQTQDAAAQGSLDQPPVDAAIGDISSAVKDAEVSIAPADSVPLSESVGLTPSVNQGEDANQTDVPISEGDVLIEDPQGGQSESVLQQGGELAPDEETSLSEGTILQPLTLDETEGTQQSEKLEGGAATLDEPTVSQDDTVLLSANEGIHDESVLPASGLTPETYEAESVTAATETGEIEIAATEQPLFNVESAFLANEITDEVSTGEQSTLSPESEAEAFQLEGSQNLEQIPSLVDETQFQSEPQISGQEENINEDVTTELSVETRVSALGEEEHYNAAVDDLLRTSGESLTTLLPPSLKINGTEKFALSGWNQLSREGSVSLLPVKASGLKVTSNILIGPVSIEDTAAGSQPEATLMEFFYKGKLGLQVDNVGPESTVVRLETFEVEPVLEESVTRASDGQNVLQQVVTSVKSLQLKPLYVEDLERQLQTGEVLSGFASAPEDTTLSHNYVIS